MGFRVLGFRVWAGMVKDRWVKNQGLGFRVGFRLGESRVVILGGKKSV